MKAKLIIVLSIFGFGVLMGAKTASPGVEFVEIPKTKVIHEEAPPPEKVTVVPESCLQAMELGDQLADEASDMYSHGDEQIHIMSEGRMAAVRGEGFTEVEELMRDLQSDNIQNLSDLSDLLYDFETQSEECNAEVPTD